VILPDFGGFIANYKPAKVDYINYNLYPPGKNISFNKNLVSNDGLLINHIASIEKLDFVESKKIVIAFVKKTSDKLNSGETVSFEGVGKFFTNKQGNLQFKPDVNSNFLLESYGLSSFHYPPKVEKEEIKTPQEVYVPRIQKSSFSGKRLFKRAAIAIPAILLLSVINYNTDRIFDQFSGISSLIPLPLVNHSSDIPEETKEDVFKIRVENIVVETPVDNSILEDELTSEIKYYIIAGSFSEKKNADKLADRLRSDAYLSLVLPEEKGRFRVAFSGHTEKNTALSELRRIRKNVEANAWLLQR